MRIDFDNDTPLSVQFIRAGSRKRVGHKHWHRKGPGKLSEEQRRRRDHNAAVAKSKRKKFLRSARAYWRGEQEEHP